MITAMGFSPLPRWSIVLPYYNEEGFIAETLRSVMALEGGPCRLILVDNASTDGTEALCRLILMDAPGLEVDYVREEQPGPVHALAAGFARVDTPFVSLWNADTSYPPDYLTRAEALLSRKDVVAAMAVGLDAAPASISGRWQRYRKFVTSRVLRWQAHTGTFGQCFRTEALRSAGGPRSDGWPWVLDDHELMHRVFRLGRSSYHPDFWCLPSQRRGSSAHVRWTVFERAVYHLTSHRAKDWFFYRFLSRRFRARGMLSGNLRQRDWDTTATPGR